MAKSREKLLALSLRKRGMSYSQIKKQIKVSKSSLSLWLRDYPLPLERIRELRDFNEKRIESYRNTMKMKREKRWRAVYRKEERWLMPLSEKELYLCGLFLYWGEGGKTAPAQLSLSNTDPEMLKFYLLWLDKVLGIHKDRVSVKLHLYKDMSEMEEIKYWSDCLGLSTIQFTKPYVKKTTLRGLTYKGLGHGTCNLIVYGRDYYEKVMLGVQAVCGAFKGLRGFGYAKI